MSDVLGWLCAQESHQQWLGGPSCYCGVQTFERVEPCPASSNDAGRSTKHMKNINVKGGIYFTQAEADRECARLNEHPAHKGLDVFEVQSLCRDNGVIGYLVVDTTVKP